MHVKWHERELELWPQLGQSVANDVSIDAAAAAFSEQQLAKSIQSDWKCARQTTNVQHIRATKYMLGDKNI